jgi:hypothetical protein
VQAGRNWDLVQAEEENEAKVEWCGEVGNPSTIKALTEHHAIKTYGGRNWIKPIISLPGHYLARGKLHAQSALTPEK